MSRNRYILEINPDIAKSIVVFSMVGERGITAAFKIDDLEVLNSDYINEHFGSLQDDAYERGHGVGYQKGFDDGKAVHDKGCEGCKYQANRELTCPCSECANNYKNYWTKEEFVRGDVVVDEDGARGIVVSSENNESNLLYVLFKGYRVPQSVVRKHYKKTGEHYDIDKFLDEIKGESNK